jgi:hypothetical protein
MSYDKISKDLHNYMQFRAAREGVEYGLSPSRVISGRA